MSDHTEISLLGMDRAELVAVIESLGEPAYRAQQLLDAVYRQRVESIEAISTLSQQLRLKLRKRAFRLVCLESKIASFPGWHGALSDCIR